MKTPLYPSPWATLLLEDRYIKIYGETPEKGEMVSALKDLAFWEGIDTEDKSRLIEELGLLYIEDKSTGETTLEFGWHAALGTFKKRRKEQIPSIAIYSNEFISSIISVYSYDSSLHVLYADPWFPGHTFAFSLCLEVDIAYLTDCLSSILYGAEPSLQPQGPYLEGVYLDDGVISIITTDDLSPPLKIPLTDRKNIQRIHDIGYELIVNN